MALQADWLRYVQQARWFAGKGLEPDQVVLRHVRRHTGPRSLPAIDSDLITLSYADHEDTYHLLVGYLPAGTSGPAGFVGRTRLDEFGDVDVVDAPSSPAARRAFLEAVGWAEAASDARLFAGEQSNSTLITPSAMVKVIRRIDQGHNPDAEALQALDGSGVTPRLLGVVSAAGYDLAIAAERISQARDGWEYASRACADGVPITEELQALGAALRRVHDGLAVAFGTSTRSGDAERSRMLDRLAVARDEAPELDPLADAMASRFDALAGRELAVQRVHSDFHLGQALLTPHGWRIIDFEGEPGTPLEERRLPQPTVSDGAGRLRALDYVRSAHEDPSGEQAREWCRSGRQAFLAGYGPDGLDESLLEAYETDRTVYEVVYEKRNRPDWAYIPLSAVQDGGSGPATQGSA